MEKIFCTVCGKELGWPQEIFVYRHSGNVAGCSECLVSIEPEDWAEHWQNQFKKA